MRKGTVVGLIAGLLLAVSVTGISASPLIKAIPNPSSHDAAFLTELLTGRVTVIRGPNAFSQWEYNNVVIAVYRGADGRVVTCDPYGNWAGQWRVAADDRHRALYRSVGVNDDLEAAGSEKRYRPAFYDPDTGVFHLEGWNRWSRKWFVKAEGWIQESWPAAAKEWCPDFELPESLPINERQTARFLHDMRKQDPDAPIRHFKGVPATSKGLAYLAPSALKRFLTVQNGHVLEAVSDADGWEAGSRYVLVLNRELDELWRLEPDSDAIEDIAYLTVPSKAREIVVRYEQSSASHRYRFGDPFPLAATGERYGAFKLMDWLTADGREVGLPFMERESVGFVFERGGTVRARKQNGEAAPGRWWWSRGELVIRLDGVSSPNSYPWQSLGVHVGWTDS